MKIKFKFMTIVVLTLMSLLSSFSFCSDDISIYVGDKINLSTYFETDTDFFSENNITWTSGNPQIVEITSKGIVYGKSVGNATVIATVGKGVNTKSKLINVTVITMVKSLEIVDSEITIYSGEKHQINYEIVPVDTNKPLILDEVKWFSENVGIAKIDSTGMVTGLRTGKTTITGKTVDGEKSDRVIITVTNSREKIAINNDLYNIKLKVGETTKLKATINNEDVSSKVFWSSSHPTLASVDQNGNVTALNEGKISIKATTGNITIYDYIDVYVKSMVKDLKFNITNITLKELGETYTLSANLIPLNEDDPPLIDTISWASTDDKIASVDKFGKITAHSDGIVRISAKSDDGNKEAGCTVRVETGMKPEREILVEEIKFNNIPEYGVYGEKIPLNYTIYPENSSDKEVKISISSGTANQIKIIDDKYYFVPSKTGDTKLTIKSSSGASDTVKIRIDSALTKLEIKPSNLKYKDNKYVMYIGQKANLDYILKTKSPYSYYNVFPAHFVLTTDAENTVSIENFDDKIVLRGINTGSAIIQSHTIDNKYGDSITISVKSPIKNPYTDKNVILPVNKIYRPNYYGEISKYNEYDFEKVDITKSYELNIKEKYIKESYVDQEIAFENKLISELEKNNNRLEIIAREDRLKILNFMKSNCSEGYCKFLANTNLTDRNGNVVRVAEIIDGNKIMGLVDGKVDITLNMTYTNFYINSSIEFTTDENVFDITTNLNNTEDYETILKNLGYLDFVKDKSLSEKIDFALKCQNRFWGKLAEDIPSKNYIESVLKLESKNLLPNSAKMNYRKSLNRAELSDFSIKVYEYLSGKTMTSKTDFRFLDTKDSNVINSYELGFISSNDSDYFSPGKKVSKNDVNYSLTNIIKKLDSDGLIYKSKANIFDFPNLSQRLESDENLSIEEMIGILGDFIN